VPTVEELDLDGLKAPAADIEIALQVNNDEWLAEIPLIEEWFDKIGDKVPTSMRDELEALKVRLRT
jgi:phosphoenolpyruvate carboxykinase (GTP)